MNKLTPREPTPEMVKAERVKFEAWCSANGHGTLDDMMMPLDRALKNLLWSAWQARAMHDAAPSGWQPIQTAPRWISVKERLPDKSVEVLVCFAGQSTLCATGQYTDNHRHDVAGWCYPAENRGCTDNGEDPVVTHWMPLPAPPSEKGE